MIWIFLVPIGLLLLGLADMPIGYYTLVRIAVFLISIFSCLISYHSDKEIGIATITFGLIAILFNPIFLVYLNDKDIWTAIDIVVAILLAIRYFTLPKEIRD